ncbi:MAG TPA: CBS domain-containing protein [Pseudomonas sp.]|nr:CBS domain-containing protein [Pseudomonas sp.]
MKISEIMTRDVQIIEPEQSIQDAASLMQRIDTGALLVHEGDRLVGMVTDRDIVLRAVAKGHGPDTPVREVMSDNIRYCFEDEDVQHVAQNMADIQLRRLPVLSRDKRLVGVVSLGNIASIQSSRASDTVLRGVAQAH